MHMSKHELKSVLRSMLSIQRHAGYTISQILDDVVPQQYEGFAKLSSSGWTCDESPVLLCVYDSIKDRGMDQCIFCGQPHERK